VVGRGEREAKFTCQFGAFAGRAAEQPQLDLGALTRNRVQRNTIGGLIGALEQCAHLVDLFGEVQRLCARLLQCGDGGEELRPVADPAGIERWWDDHAVADLGAPGHRVDHRVALLRVLGLRAELGAAVAGAAEPQIESARVQGIDGAERLDDRRGRVMTHLHRARPDPDA
jgi:hypothetical protein